jgi:hypothetical protein
VDGDEGAVADGVHAGSARGSGRLAIRLPGRRETGDGGPSTGADDDDSTAATGEEGTPDTKGVMLQDEEVMGGGKPFRVIRERGMLSGGTRTCLQSLYSKTID